MPFPDKQELNVQRSEMHRGRATGVRDRLHALQGPREAAWRGGSGGKSIPRDSWETEALTETGDEAT